MDDPDDMRKQARTWRLLARQFTEQRAQTLLDAAELLEHRADEIDPHGHTETRSRN
jgi:hypothetical protein